MKGSLVENQSARFFPHCNTGQSPCPLGHSRMALCFTAWAQAYAPTPDFDRRTEINMPNKPEHAPGADLIERRREILRRCEATGEQVLDRLTERLRLYRIQVTKMGEKGRASWQ